MLESLANVVVLCFGVPLPEMDAVGPPSTKNLPRLLVFGYIRSDSGSSARFVARAEPGVTPELYRWAQRQGAEVLTVDQNQSMIDTIWPGPEGAAVLC